jgi:hypothetical protein
MTALLAETRRCDPVVPEGEELSPGRGVMWAETNAVPCNRMLSEVCFLTEIV